MEQHYTHGRSSERLCFQPRGADTTDEEEGTSPYAADRNSRENQSLGPFQEHEREDEPQQEGERSGLGTWRCCPKRRLFPPQFVSSETTCQDNCSDTDAV